MPFVGIKLIDLILVGLLFGLKEMTMTQILRTAGRIVFCCLSVLTGIAYPLAVTAVAQVAFPRQARVDLIVRYGSPVRFGVAGPALPPRRVILPERAVGYDFGPVQCHGQ